MPTAAITTTAHAPELITAVGDASNAWSNYQNALRALQSFQDVIHAQTKADATYYPGHVYCQTHAEKSAKVATAFAEYAVLAGRVHRLYPY